MMVAGTRFWLKFFPLVLLVLFLTTVALAMPQSSGPEASAAQVTSDQQTRLQGLKASYEAGLISYDEYQRRRNAILAEGAAPAPAPKKPQKPAPAPREENSDRQNAERALDDAPRPRGHGVQAPRGFESHPGPNGGYVLVAHQAGNPGNPVQFARGAFSALRELIQELRITNAVASDDGRRILGTVHGQVDGAPIVGMFISATSENDGRFVLEFDRTESINRSAAGLHKVAEQFLPRQGAAQGSGQIKKVNTSNWTYQTGGDGSVRLLLPPGWQINGAYKGTVDAFGPDGTISLGGAGMFNSHPMPFGGNFPTSPMVAPEIGLGLSLTSLWQKLGHPISEYRVLDVQRIDRTSAFVYYSYTQQGGLHIKGLALAMSMFISSDQWMLYSSFVQSTSEKFPEVLPKLVTIWNHWKIDDRVFQERINSAMQSMREINQMMSDSIKYRQETFEKTNIAFDDYLRDQGRYSGPGGQYTVPNNLAGPFLQACNALGYNCAPLPTSQIQP